MCVTHTRMPRSAHDHVWRSAIACRALMCLAHLCCHRSHGVGLRLHALCPTRSAWQSVSRPSGLRVCARLPFAPYGALCLINQRMMPSHCTHSVRLYCLNVIRLHVYVHTLHLCVLEAVRPVHMATCLAPPPSSWPCAQLLVRLLHEAAASTSARARGA